jgi:hypothetical protein
MVAIHPVIYDVDLIQTKGYAASNLDRSSLNGRTTTLQPTEVAAHWPERRRHWHLIGARCSSRYGASISARLGPTESRERGESVQLTFKRLWAAWSADGGGFLLTNSADGMGLLWWSFGLTRTTGSFLSTSSSFSQWRIWLERWRVSGTRRRLGFGSCGSKFGENMPLFIGLLVLNCRWQRS